MEPPLFRLRLRLKLLAISSGRCRKRIVGVGCRIQVQGNRCVAFLRGGKILRGQQRPAVRP
jgi:hypothetical protein